MKDEQMENPAQTTSSSVVDFLRPETVDLFRRYEYFRQSDSGSSIPPPLSEDDILARARSIVASVGSSASSATLNRTGTAEYRCLQNGGFLRPSVRKHPWYRRYVDGGDVGGGGGNLSVLDLGCGLGADGRLMLADGFAGRVVGVDRTALYLRLGCELFGDVYEDALWDGHGSSKARSREQVGVLDSASTPLVLMEVDVTNDSFAVDVLSALAGSWEAKLPVDGKDGIKFDAVYAGKFLHCIDTKEEVLVVLQKVREVIRCDGVFFGVFGRNPPWVCGDRVEFERVLEATGLCLDMIVEEPAGATWFRATRTKGRYGWEAPSWKQCSV